MSDEPNKDDAPQEDADAKAEAAARDAAVEKEMEAMKTQLDSLKEFKERAGRIMRGSGQFDEQYEKDVRYVMLQEGWTPEEVDREVTQMKEAAQQVQEAADDKDAETVEDKETGDQVAPEILELRNQMEDMKRRAEAAEQRASEVDLSVMEDGLKRALNSTLDQNSEIGVLLKAAERVNGADESGARRQFLQEQLRQRTMDLLKQRKAKGERFGLHWFEEEASKAAAAVADSFRTVIGDPNMIQRAPETVSGEDQMVRREPPKTPKFEQGEEVGSRFKKVDDYAADFLKFAAREDAAGADTKA